MLPRHQVQLYRHVIQVNATSLLGATIRYFGVADNQLTGTLPAYLSESSLSQTFSIELQVSKTWPCHCPTFDLTVHASKTECQVIFKHAPLDLTVHDQKLSPSGCMNKASFN